MPFASTQLSVSTTPVAVLTSATTWGANTLGASLYQPVRLTVSNLSTSITVMLVPTNSTAAVGFGLPPLAVEQFSFHTDADALFALTSAAATATIGVLAHPV